MAASLLAPPRLSSEEIKSALAGMIAEERILIRPIDLIACASDASFYRLIPKAVVRAQGIDEIRGIICLQPTDAAANDLSSRRHQPVGSVDLGWIAGGRGAPLA